MGRRREGGSPPERDEGVEHSTGPDRGGVTPVYTKSLTESRGRNRDRCHNHIPSPGQSCLT